MHYMYNYSTSAKIRQGRQYNFKSEKDKSRYLQIITPIKGSFLAHITVRPVFLCLFFTIYGFWKVKIISHFLLHNLLTNAFEFVIIERFLRVYKKTPTGINPCRCFCYLKYSAAAYPIKSLPPWLTMIQSQVYPSALQIASCTTCTVVPLGM